MRISNFDNTALKILNQALEEVARLREELNNTKKQVKLVNSKTETLSATVDPTNQNSITFSWDGTTTKLSWNDSYIKDKAGNLVRVDAGQTTTLALTTDYWAAWNPNQKSMAFSLTLDPLFTIPANIIIGRIKTGSAIQVGNAGGGGTEGGQGLNGERFANF